MKNKYIKAVKLTDEVFKVDPYNLNALNVKLISITNGAAEKSKGFGELEIAENKKDAFVGSDEEMHRLIKCIKKQKPNEVFLNQLARFIYYFYIDGRKLPTSVLKAFAQIISVSDDHRSPLMELLAKDSKQNQNEAYLSDIFAFCESELERLKTKRSPDKINLIKVITNISEQGCRFDENTCQIIENHLFEDEKEAALDCLASLIQYSKFSVTDKAIAKMCGMITGEECAFSIRFSAFKCVTYSIINKSQKFSRNIQKAFIVVIDENNAKMIELEVLCLLKCKSSDIPYQIMAYLSRINIINDQQIKDLLKIMQNYIKSNDNVPKELLDRLISEGSDNQNESIRSTSVKLLELYKEKCQNIPKEIAEYLEFEGKLILLNTSTEHKGIKRTLKSLLKIDFSSTPLSVRLLNTILKLLSNDDSEEYVDFIIELITNFNENNIKVTHAFIDGVMSQYKRYKDKEEYVQLLQVFVHKYDQYNNPEVMKYALEAFSESSESIQNLWFKIISDLSKRNVCFDEDYLFALLNLVKDRNENMVFKIISNLVEKLRKVSGNFIEQISNFFYSNKYRTNICRVLAKITKKSAKVSKKLVDKLMKYSQKNNEDSKLVFEIFMNLRSNRYQLPEDAQIFADFTLNINILNNDDELNENKQNSINILATLIKRSQKFMNVNSCSKSILDLLCKINWHTVAKELSMSDVTKSAYELLEFAVNNKIVFKPGVCALIAEYADKDMVVEMLMKIREYIEEFSIEDDICDKIISVKTLTEIKTIEQLNNFIHNEEMCEDEKPLKVLTKSLANKEVNVPIMNFLKKCMVDKLNVHKCVKKYLKHLPEFDQHLFIGPLIVLENISKEQIKEIDKKLTEMLDSNLFETTFEAANLMKLGAYHKIRFEGAESKLKEIIENKSNDLTLRVEAASVFPHIYEAFSIKPEKKFIKCMLKLIPEDEVVPELENASELERLHRFCILLRNKRPLNYLLDEVYWKDMCRDILLEIVIKESGCQDTVTKEAFYQNVHDFETKHNIAGFSTLRDFALESLQCILYNDSQPLLTNINNIICMCSDIDEKLLIDLRYICTSTDYIRFLIETWLKSNVKANQRFNLHTNRAIEDLTSKMMEQRWSSYFIQILINKVIESDGECNLFEFIEFCRIYKIPEVSILKIASKLDINDSSDDLSFIKILSLKISALVIAREANIVFTDKFDKDQIEALGLKFSKLLANKEWSIDSIINLMYEVKNKCSFVDIDKALDMILSYNISYSTKLNSSTLESIIKDAPAKEWNLLLHKLGIETTFITPKEQSLDELIELVINMNPESEEIRKYAEVLKSDVLKINSLTKSQIMQTETLISEWEKDEIMKWSNNFKNCERRNKKSMIREAISVIVRVCQIIYGYPPRFTQIITVLIMINASDSGLLMQVSTGEGKSLIVGMLAVIKCLQRHTVDIITSAEHLAERDAKEMHEFYSMFGLSVSDNKDRSSGTKECYSKDIVYGCPGTFQGDLLKHEFELQKTRGDRQYDIVIVDEVDNMLIDDARHITMLSGPMPGFEYLLGLLLNCWNILIKFDQRFEVRDGKLIWINEDFKNEDGKLLMKKQENRCEVCLVHNRYEFTTDLLTTAMRGVIKEEIKLENDIKFDIPEHLKQFALGQSRCWAQSAFKAMHSLDLGVDYIIQPDQDGNDNIYSVDAKSTGSIQKQMVLSDGLHQFLQIKHNIKMTAENLITSYVSNVGFFQRYGTNLYGLTGTIGTEDSQTLLKEVYKINIGFMPTYKKKQLKEVQSEICKTKYDWIEKVVDISINEANKGRAVLIINEAIQHAVKIKDRIVEKKFPKKDLIISTGMDEENVPPSVDIGKIIVSTNLAGRGTDINTTEKVEENGGLHVIVTFLPRNQRIQDQAFGRSARKGKKGTCQLVLNKSQIERDLGRAIWDDSDIIKLRDDLEFNRQIEVKNKYLNDTFVKDEIFKNFSDFITKDQKSINDPNHRKGVIENWALWQKSFEHNKQNEKERKIKNVQPKCFDYGYCAYEISQNSDNFFPAVQHQLQIVPQHKNLGIREIKEKAIEGIIANPKVFKVNSEEQKNDFVKAYSESSKWKDNDRKIVKSIAHQLNSNIVIIDPKLELPIIEKVSNNPDANIVLARENNKYYSCQKEDINESKLSKLILDTPINKEVAYNFKRSSLIGDNKRIVKSILNQMDKENNKISQEKKKEYLKEIKAKFRGFKEESNSGVTSNNPVHSTHQGLVHSRNGNHNGAIERFRKAISQDKIFSIPAKYNLSTSIIEANENLSQGQRDEAINSLKEASSIIEDKLIPQVKSSLFQYMIKEGPDNFSESQKSGMAKQIGAKINVLEVINGNIKENMDVIKNYNPETHQLKIGGNQSLASIFSDHKDEKEAAEEYTVAGLPDLKKIVAVEKPKKKKGCGGVLMVLVGVVQIVAGALLCAASFGTLATTIGRTLITSGISDVFTGVNSLITGNPIDWKKWGLDKVGMIGASMFNFGMAHIGKAFKNLSSKSFGGAILRGFRSFMGDKGQHLINGAVAGLQHKNSKSKDEANINLEHEARKQIKQRKEVVLKECEDFIHNSKIDNFKKEEENLSENVNQILEYVEKILASNSDISNVMINCINQMIVFDTTINNINIEKLKSNTSQSVENNKELEAMAENISLKIKTILQDENTKDIASKKFDEEKVKKLFKEFKIQQDLLNFIKSVRLITKDNVKQINDKIPHLKFLFKKEYLLNEDEANQIMNLLVKENITSHKFPYLIKSLPKFEEIECTPEEKVNIKKVKELLVKIGKISTELVKDQSRAFAIGEEMQNMFLDKLVDTIGNKLENLTTSEDSKFKKNFSKAYKDTNENIHNKFAELDEKGAEYTDITSWIFGDESEQEKIEYSKTSKMLKEDMNKNPNGNLLHLVLLSHALSSPIQMIKDKKMYENIGSKFKGKPIIVVYNSNSPNKCKWIDDNNKPATSIFDLIASILNKKTDDIINICAKELLNNKQITSILRPAYKKFDKEGKLNLQEREEVKQNIIDLGNSNAFEYNKNSLEDSVSNLPLESEIKQEINKRKQDKSIYTIAQLQKFIDQYKDKLQLSDDQPILKSKQVKKIIEEMNKSCDQSKINSELISIIIEENQ